ncbi:hypothetical protein LTR91_019268 [Friedmanniomyces endolithicus]|uniref:C-CAP/cofactor C-like domain-containing protein n=1 Tax=Friedmanniomyces endolithicus TaxID=329885 RepID=A0AAN6HBE8_9PEZI|nr:hypothetical protein LTR94_015476 [Friedmanniomyces endolithicus]KAK0771648.1 hypothetical protein LTR59_015997 [Friedmanniomyces endolithicus]KAK0777658.1 hypothetical protein LTR75_015882 [Friedmanniomyces endolithicus]KAK0778089.1 hypothetical protein LTR38_014913 [Friedmanniomyces endolithicus]KAK0833523.1 hypothetical protein LTR03_014706 [Friedmanniomyces endolithicus]
MAEPQSFPESTSEITNSEKFFSFFQRAVTDLTQQINDLGSRGTSGGERADAVDHCQAGIARLSDAVKDASSVIPAYDQRTYGDAIKALSNKLQESKALFAPRPKFAFKSGGSFAQKKNASALSPSDAAVLADQRRKGAPGYGPGSSAESSLAITPAQLRSPVPERVDEEAVSQSASVKIDNRDGAHIILRPSVGHATSSGTLSNLRRCVVDMSSPISTDHSLAGLTLKNISDSLIICGHVSGAAHLTNVRNSVIVVASRQFRMHESQGCDVYVLSSGRPIIEDCTDVRFAPLPGLYMREEDHRVENQWREVDDFKWLRNEPSPNWKVLEEQQRVKEEAWRDVIPSGPGVDVSDILQAVGLSAV